MTGKPRDRAIRAALALLHQPGAAGASEAWQTVGQIGRIGAHLRSAVDEAAAFRALDAPEVCGTCGTPGTPDALGTLGGYPGAAESWTAAATELADRLEEAVAWWTAGSGFSWPAWDESSAAALGTLLCELDALAAALLTAAGYDPSPCTSASGFSSGSTSGFSFAAMTVPTADAGIDADADLDADVHGGGPVRRRPVRRRGYGGRLVPSIGLAAVAAVGVLGGITVAATQVGKTEVPKRAIVSEPVPYTLHDAEPSAAAGGGGSPGARQTQGAAAPGTAQQAAPSGNPISPASAAAAPSSGIPVSASGATGAAGSPGAPGTPGTTPVPPQGSKTPQPRDGGAPPSIPAVVPDPRQLDGVVSDIRAQAEQLQAEQLRELAERMQAAMGLETGLRTP